MSLKVATEAPSFRAAEEQESTPSTFEGLAPVLRVKLDDARIAFAPSPPAFMETPAGDVNGGGRNSSPASSIFHGTLWVTDEDVSFLPSSATSSAGKGFRLDYPALSLHAISRSIPSSLATPSDLDPGRGCMYCQIDDSGEDDEDADGDTELVELWILPSSQQDLEPLFEALSYCASLHPSSSSAEEAAGNPFASMGPFGTGLQAQDIQQLAADGAYDDVERDEEDADPSHQVNGEQHLSEAGRVTLDRLDSLVEMPASNRTVENRIETRGEASRPATSISPTNILILVHVPREVFEHSELAGALLDLLNAYGALSSWTPLPSFGRAIIVYEEVEGAQRAKSALDRLLLPLIDEDEDEGMLEDHMNTDAAPRKGVRGDKSASILRAYYGESTFTRGADGEEHLPVPVTDRNFLISPPGSPPVGWEPIKEDPPNTSTLADDLMRALGSLRDKGLGVRSHEPVDRSRRSSFSDETGRLQAPPVHLANRTTNVPAMLIEPREASVRSLHPLAREAYDPDQGTDATMPTISLPGVSVQAIDPDNDDEAASAQGSQRANQGLSISSVKATVESMRGETSAITWSDSGPRTSVSSDSKITPTARPPLD